jgi:phage portal protein BeeE
MIETFGMLYRQSGHDFPSMEKRSESISSAIPGSGAYESMTFGSPTFTGRSVNPNTAMTYTAVWACMKILAECVSSIPLLTYRNVSDEGLVTKLAVDDYRYRMLREQPNAEMSSMQWREFVMTSLLGWGNSYNFIEMDGRGRIKQIYPLRPDWMIVLRNPADVRA